EPLEGRESTEWGREDHVEDMLGEDFELDFEDGTLWLDVESGEDLWQLFSHSSPPVVSMLRRLDGERKESFHRAFGELFESYREGGRVRAPGRYLMTLGRRRGSSCTSRRARSRRSRTTSPPRGSGAARTSSPTSTSATASRSLCAVRPSRRRPSPAAY